MAYCISYLTSKRLSKWLLSGVGSGAVGTHPALLQSQGHGSQEKRGPQVMAAHAPKSGQGGKVKGAKICWDSCNVSLLNKVTRRFNLLFLLNVGDFTGIRTWFAGEACSIVIQGLRLFISLWFWIKTCKDSYNLTLTSNKTLWRENHGKVNWFGRRSCYIF